MANDLESCHCGRLIFRRASIDGPEYVHADTGAPGCDDPEWPHAWPKRVATQEGSDGDE